MEKGILLPSFYLAPIAFFNELVQTRGTVWIERFEHFPKQTYRNRCCIYSPNGKLDLIIPVCKGKGAHTVIKDVRISYDADWQRLHWMSMQTSYRSSAYFEYYEDDFAPFFHKKEVFLWDYNQKLLELLLRLLKITPTLAYTDRYEAAYEGIEDFRQRIHPKKEPLLPTKAYYQVFESKHGFLPDLSIVDLLFNQGPQARSFLS